MGIKLRLMGRSDDMKNACGLLLERGHFGFLDFETRTIKANAASTPRIGVGTIIQFSAWRLLIQPIWMTQR